MVLSKGKGIPPNNKSALTSIITLYQANLEIFKLFYENEFDQKPTKSKLDKFLKYRPSDEVLLKFMNFCLAYWKSFSKELKSIAKYLNIENSPASEYRGKPFGGNLLFRPVGFLPFVKASIVIHKRKDIAFNTIFKKMDKLNLDINSVPWHNILWNEVENKMIMNSSTVTQLLLQYMFDNNILTESELKKLKQGYASKTSYQGDNIENVLDGIN